MPNFAYSINIPFASHNPSSDQPIMQINTNSISSIIGVDHYGFNNNLGGYHKQVSLVNEAAPALPSGVGCQLTSGANNLVFSNTQIPGGVFLTNSNAPPIAAVHGSTFLPGAMIMQWGSGPTTGGFFQDTLTYPILTFYGIFSSARGFTGEVVTNPGIFTSTIVGVSAKFTNGSFVPDGSIVDYMVLGSLT